MGPPFDPGAAHVSALPARSVNLSGNSGPKLWSPSPEICYSLDMGFIAAWVAGVWLLPSWTVPGNSCGKNVASLIQLSPTTLEFQRRDRSSSDLLRQLEILDELVREGTLRKSEGKAVKDYLTHLRIYGYELDQIRVAKISDREKQTKSESIKAHFQTVYIAPVIQIFDRFYREASLQSAKRLTEVTGPLRIR